MSNSLPENRPSQGTGFPSHGPQKKRACSACSRKKIKCDMILPICSLCQRTGTSCIYSLRRKPRVRRTNRIDILDQEANVKDGGSRRDDAATGISHSTGLIVDETDPMLSSAVNGLISYHPLINSSNDPDALQESYGYALNTQEPSGLEWWDPTLSYGIPFFDLNFQLPASQTSQMANVSGTHGSEHLMPNNDGVLHTSEHQKFTSSPSEPVVVQNPRLQYVSGTLDEDSFKDLPPTLFNELVDLWFDRVQSFLPLLHRPRFKSQFASDSGGTSRTYRNLNWETSLLLNAMFALSARFSISSYFADTPCQHRGEQFAQKAKAIYEASLPRIKIPSLVYLQGLIALAFYLYSMEPDPQGWLLIGTCSRLAYALELDKIDEDNEALQTQMNFPEEWSRQEERRRAWWCIWELDAFAAAIACRRPTIDKKNMQVMLSVSDEAWFSDTPVESPIMNPRPKHTWRTLENSPNQDSRAWYLVAHYLLLSAHDLLHTKTPLPQDIKELEAALACFEMLLPGSFDLHSPFISFTELTYRQSNWIVSTHTMLQGAFIFCRFIGARAASSPLSNSSNRLLAPLAAGSQFKVRTACYQYNAEQIFYILRRWNPAYIGLHSPFMACLLVGPAAINLRVAVDSRKERPAPSSPFTGLELDLLILALKRVARLWNFGSILLDIVRKVHGDHALAL